MEPVSASIELAGKILSLTQYAWDLTQIAKEKGKKWNEERELNGEFGHQRCLSCIFSVVFHFATHRRPQCITLANGITDTIRGTVRTGITILVKAEEPPGLGVLVVVGFGAVREKAVGHDVSREIIALN